MVLIEVFKDALMYNFSKMFENSILSGRGRFCYSCDALNISQSLYTSTDIAHGSLNLVLYFIHLWTKHVMFSVVLGALPITFIFLTKDFQQFVSQVSNAHEMATNEHNLKGLIFARYNKLKDLTDSLNSIWSPIVLLVIIRGSLLIVDINDYVSKGLTVTYLIIGLETMFITIAVTIMAEGCRIVIRS